MGPKNVKICGCTDKISRRKLDKASAKGLVFHFTENLLFAISIRLLKANEPMSSNVD